MMKFRTSHAVSVLVLLSLTGCASQAQIDEQNKQLAAMNVTLMQIQENQLEAIALQKSQIAVQAERKNLQTMQYQQQLQRK